MSSTEERIAEVRGDLAVKLEELQRRGTRVRAALSPSTYLQNPWLRVGLGFVVGFAVGHRASRATEKDDVAGPAGSPLLRGVVRASLLAVFEALLREAVAGPKQPLATSARPSP